MKKEMTIQEAGTMNEARLDNRAKLTQHLAQQPQSRQTFDKVMKALEVVGLALIAGYLAWAIYVSVNWSAPQEIAAVWFGFPASISVLLALVSLHGAGLRAFFPIIVPNSSLPFVTGSKAVGMGLASAAALLIVGAFWGAFAWGVWTTNWAILEPLVHITAVVVTVGVAFAVASDLYTKFFRAR